jgi:SOS-response transcriptional repressor LexA
MYTGKKLGEAIKSAIELKGVRKADVARAFAIKPPSVTSWIQTGRVDKAHIDKLVSYFADVVQPEHFGIGSFEANEILFNGYKVPLLTWIDAATQRDKEALTAAAGNIWVPTLRKPGAQAFALEIKGDSMEPEFTPGDKIVVEPEQPVQHGCFVVVRENDSEAMFKQYISEGSHYYLKPLNNRYPIIEMSQRFHICGVVVEKFKIYI